jgi:DNA segregation ATPase FtsK/SpoIIIE-like protein
LAQQKTQPDKTSRKRGKANTKAAKPVKPETSSSYEGYEGRYVVKPEFWDNILDNIPSWGDEIAAIVLIVFGIVSFLSLFNVSSDATIATAWSNALTSLFGYGSVVVSAAILLLGVFILLPKAGIIIRFPTARILAIEVAFLSLLAVMHLMTGDAEWRAVARVGNGGGIIGWGLSILISTLMGSLFALFIYISILIFCLAYIVGVRWHHISNLLQRSSDSLRRTGEKLAEVPESKRAIRKRERQKQDAQQEALDALPPALRRMNIIRIRPYPDNIPPSQRSPEGYARPVGTITEPDTTATPSTQPLTIPLSNAEIGAPIVPEFNAIGTLKKKRSKDDVQLVERPDGRIKRYFEVEKMQEARKVARRDAELPPLEILKDTEMIPPDEEEINNNVVLIENTLLEFDIDVDIVDVKVGPTVTQYAIQPFRETDNDEGEKGVQRTRINKIASLSNDLALALAARRLRLETPVPGESYIGIEVPNKNPSVVTFRSVYESKYYHDLMKKKNSPLLVPLGRDVAGRPFAADIGQMPHLLIAGTTGSGKSVAIAAVVMALIMTNTPDMVKMVMMDPKMVELTRFNGIPHLIGPVETDQERIIGVLRWCTREMDRRYKLLEEHSARNIDTFNSRLGRRRQDERLPYIVIMIDEIGDLMMSQPEETERAVTRLAQMARAVGMHLIVATQRPSVDVITGLIKANFPTRMSFAVASGIDSRVILDTVGAENLLGSGDMLYLASDAAGPQRIQGCFVAEDEVRAVVNYWKDWTETQIKENKMERIRTGPWERGLTRRELLAQTDPMLEEAIEAVIEEGEASASLIQRRLGLGYPRAARIIDMLYELRVIGPAEAGGRGRKVLIKPGEDPFKEEIDRRTNSL